MTRMMSLEWPMQGWDAPSVAMLEQARRGDPEAMEGLYRAHEKAVYTLAYRLCGRPEEAEEILQETFLEVARSLRRFRGDGKLGAWIRRIAANKAISRLRSENLRRTEPLTVVEQRSAAAPPQRLDLAAALTQLSDTARAVVWLHDVEGYTHREIGKMMRRSVSFSKSQLARAHRRLRQLLDDPGERS